MSRYTSQSAHNMSSPQLS